MTLPRSTLAILLALSLEGSALAKGHGAGSPFGGGHPAAPPRAPRGYWVPAPYFYDPYWYGWGYWYTPYLGPPMPYPPPPGPESVPPPPPPEEKITGLFGLEAQSLKGGSGFGLSLGFERDRIGFSAKVSGLYPGLDNNLGISSLYLVDLSATYAAIEGPNGSIHLKAGIESAFAPNVAMTGPALGASGVFSLWGPLGIDAEARITPFPFQEVDLFGGAHLGFGPVALRVGWRRIWFDDAGNIVGGWGTQDVFRGIYFGLALGM